MENVKVETMFVLTEPEKFRDKMKEQEGWERESSLTETVLKFVVQTNSGSRRIKV